MKKFSPRFYLYIVLLIGTMVGVLIEIKPIHRPLALSVLVAIMLLVVYFEVRKRNV